MLAQDHQLFPGVQELVGSRQRDGGMEGMRRFPWIFSK